MTWKTILVSILLSGCILAGNSAAQVDHNTASAKVGALSKNIHHGSISLCQSTGLDVAGDISPPGDFDSYTVTVCAGADLLMSIGETGGSGFVLLVEVYGPNGQLIDVQSVNTGFQIDLYNVPSSGDYTYIVRENGDNATGSYRLSVVVADKTVDADNVELTSGQLATGSINTGDIDTFTIDATPGSDLVFSIGETGGSGFLLSVVLYGPDGQFIDSASFNTGFQLDRYNVAGGTYTYIIRENGSDSTGSYQLTAVVIDQAVDNDNTQISSGQLTTGSINTGDIDTFTIDATPGSDLAFSIGETGGSGFLLSVVLYGPDGQLIDSASFNTGFQLDQYNVIGGTYTYVIRENGSDSTGSYQFTTVVIDQAIDNDNTQLFSGQLATDSINIGDIDTFTIDATPGSDLVFSIGETGGSGFLLSVALYGPNGQFIDSASFNTGFQLDQYNVIGGTYTYVIRENGSDSTGSYQFTAVVIDQVLDADNTDLISGQLTTGNINIGDIDTFTIDAISGSDLLFSINETGGSGFVLLVDVYDPNGQFIVSRAVDSGFQINLINLVLSGTYTYIVREFGGNSTGSYALTATVD